MLDCKTSEVVTKQGIMLLKTSVVRVAQCIDGMMSAELQIKIIVNRGFLMNFDITFATAVSLPQSTQERLKISLSELFQIDACVINLISVNDKNLIVSLISPTMEDVERMQNVALSSQFESILIHTCSRSRSFIH